MSTIKVKPGTIYIKPGTKIPENIKSKIVFASNLKEAKKKRTKKTKIIKKKVQKPKIIKPKIIKPKINYAQKVIDFQNSNKEKLIFKNLNDKVFKQIISAIRIIPNKITTLKSGDTTRMLNADSLSNLSRVIVNEQAPTESDEDLIINSLEEIKTLTIEQLTKEKYSRRHRRQNFTAEDAKDMRDYAPRRGGAYFPYNNPTKVDLTRQGIWSEIKEENFKYNCLELAIKNSDLFTKEQIQSIRFYLTANLVPVCKLPKIAEELECEINLKQYPEGRVRKFNEGQGDILYLGLAEDHYFLNENTEYTRYCLEHYKEVKDRKNWNSFVTDNQRKTNRYLTSYEVIKIMLEQKLFIPQNLNTENILKTQYYETVDQILETLEYDDKCVRPINLDKHTKKCKKNCKEKHYGRNYNKIYYADFEASTDGSKHKEYLCCIIDQNGREKTFYGKEAGLRLLEYLEHNSLVYFHNLGYDFDFMSKYFNLQSEIKTGSMDKSLTGNFKGKKIFFKDSLAIIDKPLYKFSELFKLDIKKEILPYSIYTEENVEKPYLEFSEVLKAKELKDLVKREEFVELAREYINNGKFDHMSYARFYCMQDCRVLKQGFEIFRGWIKEAFGLDVIDFVSLPSLCHRIGYQEGCFDNCYELSGTPQIFIQKCVKGGRCMTRDNKKWHITEELNDFDAVSLYPSAMSQMGFLQGRPKVIPNNKLNMDFLNKVDGYFVEINNVVLGKHLHFPLEPIITKGESRNYVNEFPPNHSLFLTKYALEDLIKYQKATFNIVRGYYFDEGRNYQIQKTIINMFEQRKQKKKEGNQIQEVYKLLMNAFYGKTIQKAIKYEYKFKNTAKQHEDYIRHRYNYIIEYVEYAKDKYKYKERKSIDKHFNCVHIGSEILSMSKRLMNEVMCLAEDLDIKIYYQDTDSMHIVNNDINKLSLAFKNKTGKDLIGENMCQFHNDFSINGPDGKPSKKLSEGAVSIESYFLGKKSYIDKLKALDNSIHHHIRMKGIPSKLVENPMETYKKLYNSIPITYDLGKLFNTKRNKDFSHTTNTSFKRTVKF